MQHDSTQRQPRVVIYSRVSTDKQEIGGSSLFTQSEACRAYAAEREYEVVGEYTDTFTGAKYRERPGLNQLRELVRAGAVDVVLCHALDRLSRNQAHVSILMEEIDDAGASLELVTEDFEDSAVGRFLMNAKAFAAEVQREKNTEGAIRGLKRRAESGKLIPGQRALYGYQYTDDTRSKYEVNPQTCKIVQRIFTECVEGSSMRSIAQRLTDDGIPSPTGNANWQHSTIASIIRNPAYKGEAFAWGYQSGVRGFNPERAIALPEGTIPPLVDARVWEQSRRVLDRNQRHTRRYAKHPEVALLRGGYAKCGVCGHPLWVVTRGHGTGHDYRCGDRIRTQGTGHTHTISVKILDAAVWGWVRHLLLDDDALKVGMEARQQHDTSMTDELAIVTKALGRIDRQRNNLVRSISEATDPDTIASLVSHMDSLSKQYRELVSEQSTLQEQSEHQTIARETLQHFDTWRKQVNRTLDMMTWSEKRQLLDLLGISAQVWDSSHDPRWMITSEILPEILSSTAP
jgi:site-specific DNA recombinase